MVENSLEIGNSEGGLNAVVSGECCTFSSSRRKVHEKNMRKEGEEERMKRSVHSTRREMNGKVRSWLVLCAFFECAQREAGERAQKERERRNNIFTKYTQFPSDA